jgi:hypothetical protein
MAITYILLYSILFAPLFTYTKFLETKEKRFEKITRFLLLLVSIFIILYSYIDKGFLFSDKGNLHLMNDFEFIYKMTSFAIILVCYNVLNMNKNKLK